METHSVKRRRNAGQALWRCALVCSIAAFVTRSALGQSDWEFTPYHVLASVVFVDRSDASEREQQSIEQSLAQLADASFGAAWKFQTAAPSAALRGEIGVGLADLTAEQILTLDPPSADCDKRMLATVSRAEIGYALQVRELDVATRQLGPVFTRSARDRSRLPLELLQAFAAAFAPLVELERADGDQIAGKLRAAALVDESVSPLLVETQTPLAPVLRINDRLGRSASDQISALPLTVLVVTAREGARVECQIHAAARHRLGARATLRLSRLGLAVRAPPRDTRVVLQSSLDGAPLADYELVERDSGDVRVVARTDAFGVATIAADDRPWRMLYVRQGEHLLARLPFITGQHPALVVPLASNDVRLRAECFVAALTQEVVDTVARRQILASRMRARIASGDFDQAQSVLEELQRLAARRDYDERLQTARLRFVGDNARAQQHINELFAETRESLARYLDPQEIKRLETQLAQARHQR